MIFNKFGRSYEIDRNQIALVFDGSGVQKSRYLYGTQVDQVLAEESGTQVRWFLTDHQGSVKDVIDNGGTVIDHITYDSFGRIVGQTSPIDLRFTYTGREWDGETGQYYYRARYYDAAVGKFISEDPIGFAGGDSNLSRYVGNSVTNFIDPSGSVEVLTPPPVTTSIIPVVGEAASGTSLGTLAPILVPVAGAALIWGTVLAQPTASNDTIPRPQLPKPQPQNTPTTSTEAYGPRETLSPAESQRWREYYDAQDRKVLREAAAQKLRDRRRKADLLRQNGFVVPPDSVLDNIEISPEPQTETERDRRNPGKGKGIALETLPQDEKPKDPNCLTTEEEEKKPCPTRILFRGDSRTPLPSSPALRNGIFNQGFRSRGLQSTTLEDYVFKNADGIFIGTSEIRPPAITFATSNIKTKTKRDGYVYEICDPGGGININDRFKDNLEFFQKKYDKQREIAFERLILNENIKGATFYDRNRNRGTYYKNPNYKYKS